jgi:tetratricopeptide (TPR) repeat protein
VYLTLFSPDGRRVVTASEDEARIWDTASGLLVTPPLKHNDMVLHAWFSPDGRRLVTAGGDEARVWDVASGLPLSPRLKHIGRVSEASFSPDGRRVVTGSDIDPRIWDLPRDNRSAGDLLELAEVLAAARLDEQGGLERLDMETWSAAWNRLSKSYPAPLAPSADEIRAWQQEEARACVEAKLWTGALLHLDPLIEAEPGNNWCRAARGQAHAALGHWAEAAADFQKSLEAEPSVQVAGWHLLSLAGAGSWDNHRQACAALLERFARQGSGRIVWYSVRFRQGLPDATRCLKLAEQLVEADPKQAWSSELLGAALYRAGRYADAIKNLEDSIQLQKAEESAVDWLFLAMAHQKLNHTEEAKKWLTKAQKWIDQSKEGNSDGARRSWDQRLELQLIRGEAEAVIGNAP